MDLRTLCHHFIHDVFKWKSQTRIQDNFFSKTYPIYLYLLKSICWGRECWHYRIQEGSGSPSVKFCNYSWLLLMFTTNFSKVLVTNNLGLIYRWRIPEYPSAQRRLCPGTNVCGWSRRPRLPQSCCVPILTLHYTTEREEVLGRKWLPENQMVKILLFFVNIET